MTVAIENPCCSHQVLPGMPGDGVAPGSTVWFVPADFLSDAQAVIWTLIF
jgi:hypothetical protein